MIAAFKTCMQGCLGSSPDWLLETYGKILIFHFGVLFYENGKLTLTLYAKRKKRHLVTALTSTSAFVIPK